jgi:hypothetical protein
MKMKYLLAITALTISGNAFAEEYSLFNPTPDDKLRAFTTERPSKTDGIFTVDPGRLVIETSLVNYTHENNNDTKTQGTTYGAATNFRLGLTENNDVQLIVDSYRQLRVESAGAVDEKDGFGDITLRFKHNFFGNDGSKYGLATIAYVKAPTNQNELANDAYEGGVEVPFSINLANNYSFGGMTVVSALEDSDGEGYNAAFTNSLIVGKTFNDKWSGYAEFFTFRNSEEGSHWQNTLDFGVVYSVNDSWKLDAGVNFGVTDYADDTNLFIGTAYRF